MHEVENGGGGFLGKPYEPNAVVKNDVEFILMQRKPGGYRRPSLATRILSFAPTPATPPIAKVSHGIPPPMSFDLSLSEQAGFRALDRLIRRREV